MEKSVLFFPRLAACKSLIVLVVLMLVSASIKAQPVFVQNINNTSHSFTNVNGKIYFASNDSLFTASMGGVEFIKKLNEKIKTISEVTMGDKFFVITAPSSGQQGFWVSSGTAASTVKLGTFTSVTPQLVYGTDVYLAIDDGTHGLELWKLSASNELSIVKDINPGAADGYSTYRGITISNNQLYFVADDGAGSDIWKTDGTSAGTVKAVDLPFQGIQDLTDVNGTMYFEHDSLSEDSYDRYAELWKTHGTTATTELVKDYKYNYMYNSLGRFTPFNGKLYFFHFMEAQIDLWMSDGTQAGTQLVTEAATGIETSFYDVIRFQEYLVWYSETQGAANPVMKNDGTSSGTSVVHELNYIYTPPGYDFSYVDLTPAGDRLYFVDHATYDWPTDDQLYVLYESTPEYTPSTSRSMLERYNFPYNNTKNLTAVTGNDVVFTTWDTDESYYRLWYYDPDGNSNTLCSGTGGLSREVWTNVTGNKVSSIPLNTPPDYVETVTEFAGPVNDANNYGARYSGYLCVPVSGEYKFMIASDDYSELYLSTTADKADKKLIAYVYGATRQNDFTRYPSQKSASIQLEKGTKYYVEALHKEGGTYDHIMVAMQHPDGTIENPILGTHLIPALGDQPPVVTITQPAGDEVDVDSNSTIAADASDADASIVKVEFYVKNLTHGWEDRIGVDTEAPYQVDYSFQSQDRFLITAKAYSSDNGLAVDTKEVSAISCQATGRILRELWTNVSGQRVSDIPLNTPPTSSRTLSIFEGPTNEGDRYGARISGYVCVPMDGEYTFYISSDDHSELWLSTDSNPENKRRIAYVPAATSKRQWNKYASQQSAKIFMRKGKYYIEALHKEHLGYDHISVGWQLPDGVMERPIPGSRLSPFEPSATMAAQSADESELMTVEENSFIDVAPNPVTTRKVTMTAKGKEFGRGSVMAVQLVSMTGEVVYTNQFPCDGGCGSLELDFSDKIVPGLYLLKANDGEQIFTRRLIIK